MILYFYSTNPRSLIDSIIRHFQSHPGAVVIWLGYRRIGLITWEYMAVVKNPDPVLPKLIIPIGKPVPKNQLRLIIPVGPVVKKNNWRLLIPVGSPVSKKDWKMIIPIAKPVRKRDLKLIIPISKPLLKVQRRLIIPVGRPVSK